MTETPAPAEFGIVPEFEYASQPPRSRGPGSDAAITIDEESEETRRDVKALRARGLFAVSCRSFCQSRRRRRLSGKAVFLVLAVQFLERLTYVGTLSQIIGEFLDTTHLQMSAATKALVQSLVLYIAAPLFYPLAGWIADVWVGRYRMARWCLGALWIGYVGVSITFAVFSHDAPNRFGSGKLCIIIFLFVLITVGSAGVEVNLIPFGADQVLYKTSDELSSYFYWHYWVRNLAGFTYFTALTCTTTTCTATTCTTTNTDRYHELHIAISSCFAAAVLTLALSLNFLCGSWLSDNWEKQNPPKLILRVLCNALSAERPRARSAFSYTGRAQRPDRLDLAKQQHGGKFRSEQVEDVKTFWRLLLLLFSIGGALILFTGITNVMALQFNHMSDSYMQTLVLRHGCRPSTTSVWIFNILTILATILFLDQCLYPCLRQYAPNMLKRFGISYILLIASAALLTLYESIGHHWLSNPSGAASNGSCMFGGAQKEDDIIQMTSWLTLVPVVLVAIAEIFLKVTALEFVYAQSPHSMQGMMVGLVFWVDGISSSMSALLLFGFSHPPEMLRLLLHQSCGFWYYLILCVLGIVTFVLYIIISIWYRNRTRGDLDSERYYRLQIEGSTQYLH